MTRARFWGIGCCCLVTILGCKVTQVSPVTFPAEYRPVTGGHVIDPAPPCAVIRDLAIEDDRADKRVVGRRTIQGRDGQSEILVAGDTEEWLRLGLQRALDRASVSTSPTAEFNLAAKLTKLFVEEIAFRNSTFECRLELDVAVYRADSGHTVWSFQAVGTADNYGRPGKPINYQETIGWALDRAAAEIVTNEQLHHALCGSSAP